MTPEKARQLEQFADAYAEALYWSSTDERDGETVNLDDYMTSTQADDKCRADCLDFFTENYDNLAAAAGTAGYSWSHAGHDFALTRNHHGAGYWDRGLGALGDALTRAAHAAGEAYAYLGDDELVYVQ